MPDIRIELRDQGVAAAFNRLIKTGQDLSPVMRDIADALEAEAQRAFERERDPETGAAWEALSPGRIAEREESGTWPGQILTETGTLRASLTKASDATSATVGSNLVYAAIHQFGGKTKPRFIYPKTKKALHFPGARHPVKKVYHPGSDIPARPFLGVSAQTESAIIDIINQHLNRALT